MTCTRSLIIKASTFLDKHANNKANYYNLRQDITVLESSGRTNGTEMN